MTKLVFSETVGGLVNESIGRGQKFYIEKEVFRLCEVAGIVTPYDRFFEPDKLKKISQFVEEYVVAWNAHLVASGKEMRINELNDVARLSKAILGELSRRRKKRIFPFD